MTTTTTIRQGLFRAAGRATATGGRRHPRLGVQRLEERAVPAVFTVNDYGDAGLGTGTLGDLRYCLTQANATLGSDTIEFDSAFGSETINLGSELTITDSVTVSGLVNGVTLTFAAPPINTRVLRIDDGSNVSSIKVLISNMTMAGGVLKDANPGAGIYVGNESVTLTNCSVTRNSAVSGGGGIHLRKDAKLTLASCNISDNTSSAAGGGGIDAASSSTVTLNDTTVANNICYGAGGGIQFLDTVSFKMERSTVSGNQVLNGSGGGIMLRGVVSAIGSFEVLNSTLAENSASVSGGAVCLTNTMGQVTVNNSTIFANSAAAGIGGGIALINGSATISTNSTVVSGNQNATSPDISSTATVNVNYCAIGSSSGFTATGANNLAYGLDLKLSPLDRYNGPTRTCAPIPGSPLISAGSNPSSLTIDQRGLPRLIGTIDIGAFEAPAPIVVVNENDSGTGSLRQALIDANGNSGFDAISFDPIAFSTAKTITLTSGQLSVSDSVVVVGPATSLTIDANHASRAVRVELNSTGDGIGEVVGFFNLSLTKGQEEFDTGGAIAAFNSSLRLTNCFVSASKAFHGGGIFAHSTALVVSNCVVTGNSAFSAGGYLTEGGGIATQASLTRISNSTISNNRATFGGGIWADGNGISFFLSDSEISGNSAIGIPNPNPVSSAGAGLYIGEQVAATTVEDSIITGNTALSGNGAGVFAASAKNTFISQTEVSLNEATYTMYGPQYAGYGGGVVASVAIIASCTISGNIGYKAGGGVRGWDLDIFNSTIAENVSPVAGAGVGGAGVNVAGGTLLLDSSIVAKNFGSLSSGPGIDILNGPGTYTNCQFSFVGDKSGLIESTTSISPIDGDPLFGPFANYGGDTRTYSLNSGSKAIDAGQNSLERVLDQRGNGYFRAVNRPDIGAYEVQGIATPTTVTAITINEGNIQRSNVTVLTITFSDVVVLPDMNEESAFALYRTTAVNEQSGITGRVNIDATLNLASTVVTLTFLTSGSNPVNAVSNLQGDGGTPSFTGYSLADGIYTLTIIAGKVNRGSFDGNDDGKPGDHYRIEGSPTGTRLYRLFGDADGGGSVDNNEFSAIKTAFGGPSWTFDYNNDGSVAISDFNAFKARFLDNLFP